MQYYNSFNVFTLLSYKGKGKIVPVLN